MLIRWPCESFWASSWTRLDRIHSSVSRTRLRLDLDTHQHVFQWILEVPAKEDLVEGKTVGIDATTLQANAALRSIVRRDNGESCNEYLDGLAQASGI